LPPKKRAVLHLNTELKVTEASEEELWQSLMLEKLNL